jgi:hypothetical protein
MNHEMLFDSCNQVVLSVSYVTVTVHIHLSTLLTIQTHLSFVILDNCIICHNS